MRLPSSNQQIYPDARWHGAHVREESPECESSAKRVKYHFAPPQQPRTRDRVDDLFELLADCNEAPAKPQKQLSAEVQIMLMERALQRNHPVRAIAHYELLAAKDHDSHSFALALKACALTGDVSRAEIYFKAFAARNSQVEVTPVNCLIETFAKGPNPQHALELFDSLAPCIGRPGAELLGHLLAACARLGQPRRAIKLLRDLIDEHGAGGIKATIAHFETMMEMCAAKGDFDAMVTAIRLAQGIGMKEAATKAAIRACAMRDCHVQALNLFATLDQRFAQLDPQTAKLLIKPAHALGKHRMVVECFKVAQAAGIAFAEDYADALDARRRLAAPK